MIESDESKKENFCFTIMPYGDWFDTYYSEIYLPAIEQAGLVSKRADDLYRPSSIVHDIWQYTKECEIVLADLTGKNPNVLYELGLAHAIAKPVILIVERMEDIPYDLRALRIIEYDKNAYNWGELLKEKIVNAIIEIILAPIKAVPHAFLDAIKFPVNPPIENKDKKEIVTYVSLFFQAEIYVEYHFEYHKFQTFQSFADSIWFYLNKFIEVEPYTYGKTWKIRDSIGQKAVDKVSQLNSGRDFRTLQEAGILMGDKLEVVFLK